MGADEAAVRARQPRRPDGAAGRGLADRAHALRRPLRRPSGAAGGLLRPRPRRRRARVRLRARRRPGALPPRPGPALPREPAHLEAPHGRGHRRRGLARVAASLEDWGDVPEPFPEALAFGPGHACAAWCRSTRPSRSTASTSPWWPWSATRTAPACGYMCHASGVQTRRDMRVLDVIAVNDGGPALPGGAHRQRTPRATGSRATCALAPAIPQEARRLTLTIGTVRDEGGPRERLSGPWVFPIPLAPEGPMSSGAAARAPGGPRGRRAVRDRPEEPEPLPHRVPARPRPDPPHHRVPAAEAQDPGLRGPGGRPLPHPADPHPRGVGAVAHRRPGAAAERGPGGGDRHGPRPRPRPLRARGGGGARRPAARAPRPALRAQRPEPARRGGAGAGRSRPEPDPRGAGRHPAAHRQRAPRHPRGADRAPARPGRLRQPRHRGRPARGRHRRRGPARRRCRRPRRHHLGAAHDPGGRRRRRHRRGRRDPPVARDRHRLPAPAQVHVPARLPGAPGQRRGRARRGRSCRPSSATSTSTRS